MRDFLSAELLYAKSLVLRESREAREGIFSSWTGGVRVEWGEDKLASIMGLALSPDGTLVTIGVSGGPICLLDSKRNEIRTLPGTEAGTRSLAFSHNG
ncbi:MAG: hypothetical protein HY720_18615 [Planctomycetes bacterium]|nr:hypothetical protein [Planctomycetota bacterium]